MSKLKCPKCKKKFEDFRKHLDRNHSHNEILDIAVEYVWIYDDLNR